jgi:hypothetical protein
VEIRPTLITPGQRGVFALKPLRKDQSICQYSGPIIRTSLYEAGVKAGLHPNIRSLVHIVTEMDLHGMGGFSQCHLIGLPDTFGPTINHSDDPNCVVTYTQPKGAGAIPYRLLMVKARRTIREGEELTIDYGTDKAAILAPPDRARCCIPKCSAQADSPPVRCSLPHSREHPRRTAASVSRDFSPRETHAAHWGRWNAKSP